MSKTFEIGIYPTIKWKFCKTYNVSNKSPKFRFGNAEYCLKSYSSNEEVTLSFSRECKITDPFMPSSVTVHVVNDTNGQIVPSLTRTVARPSAGTVFWRMRLSEIEKVYPNCHWSDLTCIVTYKAEELVTDEKSVQTSLCINPIPCSESLSEDLETLLQLDSDSNPDVEFQSDGHCIKAHRMIVSARSPVLAKMLQSQMVEGETGIIKIEDMDLDSLKIFVRYLYKGSLDEAPNYELAVVLYESADKYEVQSLARRCAQFLIEGLTVENACEVLDLAHRHSDEKFVEEVIVFVLEKKVPLASEHWRAFCSSHPQLALDIYSRFSEMYVRNPDP